MRGAQSAEHDKTETKNTNARLEDHRIDLFIPEVIFSYLGSGHPVAGITERQFDHFVTAQLEIFLMRLPDVIAGEKRPQFRRFPG